MKLAEGKIEELQNQMKEFLKDNLKSKVKQMQVSLLQKAEKD